jgi:hypothetical protein
VLIRTSLRLGKRSHDFLVGAWLLTPATSPRQDGDDFTQPLRPADEDRVRAFLLDYPGVTAIREVLVTFTGPGRAWVPRALTLTMSSAALRSSHWSAASSRHEA